MEPAGKAQLLHVVETKSAVLRHAFYRKGARVMQRGLSRPAVLYSVGGPVLDAASGAEAFERRLVYLPVGYEQALRYEGNTHVLTIESDPPRAGSAHLDAPGGKPIPLIAPLYEQVWDILIAIADRKPNAAVIRSIEQFLPACKAAIETPPQGWLADILDRLHAQWRVPPLLAGIARRYGKSKQHVCRAFKSLTGTTVRRYSMMIRLDHARGLIWGTDMPLSEIASATGFTDQSHLTNALSLLHSITPRRLRLAAPCLQRQHFFVDDLVE